MIKTDKKLTPKKFNLEGKKNMATDTATDKKMESVGKDIEGLRSAVRTADENHYQSMGLMGLMREELDFEKNKVKRLQLEMEEVYKFLKSKKNELKY